MVVKSFSGVVADGDAGTTATAPMQGIASSTTAAVNSALDGVGSAVAGVSSALQRKSSIRSSMIAAASAVGQQPARPRSTLDLMRQQGYPRPRTYADLARAPDPDAARRAAGDAAHPRQLERGRQLPETTLALRAHAAARADAAAARAAHAARVSTTPARAGHAARVSEPPTRPATPAPVVKRARSKSSTFKY